MKLLLPGNAWIRRSAAKLLLIMKLTATILLVSTLYVTASIFSQSVSISGKDISLEKVFNAITSQTGYEFGYGKSVIEKSKLVSVDFKDAPLKDVLDKCLIEQGLSYELKNKIIMVKLSEPVKKKFISLFGTNPPVSRYSARAGWATFGWC